MRKHIKNKIPRDQYKLAEVMAGAAEKLLRMEFHIAFPQSGLCMNLEDIMWGKYFPGRPDAEFDEEEFYNILYSCFYTWPLFSGDKYFPLPGGEDAYRKSQEGDTLWKGKNLELRLDLLKHIIDCLRGVDPEEDPWEVVG